MCFELEGGNTPVRVFFHVDFKSRSAQAIENAKKAAAVGKGDIPILELQLKAAEDLVTEISKEIDFARRQENLLREAGGGLIPNFIYILLLLIGLFVIRLLFQML